MRIFEPIAGIEGIASGATASVKVPVNRRLHSIKLFAQATAPGPVTVYGADVIDEVLQYVGGRLIRVMTALELLFLRDLNAALVTPAVDISGVPIFYSEPWRASVMDEQVSAWDLFGQSDMTLKVKIKPGLTNPTLNAIMCHDDGFTTNAQGQRVLNIVKHTPFFFNAGSSYDITGLDIDKPISRIYLFPEALKSIDAVKVVINDTQTVHEMTAKENAAFLADYGLSAVPGPVGDPYPVLFDANQQFFDSLPPVRSLRLTVKSSAAGQIKAILENRATAYI
jgi:hypothetical protein